MTKSVDISIGVDAIKPVPLNSQIPGSVFVGFGVFQIDLVVGRIVIPGDDKAAALFFIFIGIVKKCLVKIKFKLQAFFVHLPIGKIYIKKYKIIEIQFEDPAFVIIFGFTDTVFNA